MILVYQEIAMHAEPVIILVKLAQIINLIVNKKIFIYIYLYKKNNYFFETLYQSMFILLLKCYSIE